MEWYVNFFDEFYNKLHTFKDWKQTREDVDLIEKLLDLSPNDKILDVPCGFGRHSIELIRRGYSVVGVDYNQPQIDRAKSLMERTGVYFDIVKSDMRNLPFEEEFDKLFNFFTSFGYFSDDENEKTIRQFHKALKKGGKILLDVINRDYIITNFEPASIVHRDDGSIFIDERIFNPLTSRIKSINTLITPDGSRSERKMELRIYSLHELLSMFKRNGFKVVNYYDNKGKEFKINSFGIIVVAEKV